MKILLSIIMYFYALFFLFIVILIYPIFKIKIGNIQSRTIGNGSIAYEIFYYEMKEKDLKKKNEFYIWFTEKKISNEFIIKKFKENFSIIPGILLFSPFTLIKKLKLNFLLVPIENKKFPNRDDNEVLIKYPKLINFNQSEISYAKKICKIFDIKDEDKIICASARISKFKNERFKSNQNADINSYYRSFKYLTDNDYKVILIGDNYENLPNNFNDKIIPYSNSEYKNSMLDFYLMSRASFLIQSPSGIGEIAAMMRIPRLIVNFWGLETLITYAENSVQLIIPKKVTIKKENKQIHYLDLTKKMFNVKTNTYRIFNYNEMDKAGYNVEDNSADEILDGVKEMKKMVENKDSIKKNKQVFWDHYNQIFVNKKIRKIRIVDSFYRKNLHLFE